MLSEYSDVSSLCGVSADLQRATEEPEEPEEPEAPEAPEASPDPRWSAELADYLDALGLPGPSDNLPYAVGSYRVLTFPSWIPDLLPVRTVFHTR